MINMKNLFTILFTLCIVFNINAQVVINEIYGGGGNTGATWTHDVVQLKNLGSTSVDLSNYAIQYASATGSFTSVNTFPSGTTIAAGAILNVMLATGGSNGATPPNPRVQAPGTVTNIGTRSGKLALTDNTVALTGSSCPTTAVDYVGYGTTTGCGPHTDATIPSGDNTKGYVRTNTAIPGSYVIKNNPLPVQFYSFNADLKGRSTSLSFSTATETDNDYFTIERSGDGRTFDAIGKIQGAGNSAVKQSYAFTDENPLPRVNYYRIKQTDYNGSYNYTEVKSVRHRISNSIITPGKTDGILFVTSDLKSYDVVVYNTAGQEVQRNKSLSGDQNFSIENLQPGIYFVRILDQTFKVLKY